jgi:hypothetical protein
MVMTTMKLPCDGCIVLACCKSRLTKFSPNRYNAWRAVVKLSESCELLKDYVQPMELYNYNLEYRRTAVFFLTGVDLRKRRYHHL